MVETQFPSQTGHMGVPGTPIDHPVIGNIKSAGALSVGVISAPSDLVTLKGFLQQHKDIAIDIPTDTHYDLLIVDRDGDLAYGVLSIADNGANYTVVARNDVPAFAGVQYTIWWRWPTGKNQANNDFKTVLFLSDKR